MNIEAPPSSERIRELYPYQVSAIAQIEDALSDVADDTNLLFQLPTGGGKTIIFAEIARRYIAQYKKKVLILTHRIELLTQTSNVLAEFSIRNKVITSEVRELADQNNFDCYTAMVETLHNRLSDDENYIGGIGLVIIDEAHYNSFRKLFRYFEKVKMLGVTATPLSANKNYPLNEHYSRLIVGESIGSLIDSSYLAKGTTYTYSVNLKSLKVGITGDFTVGSSDRLYGQDHMQNRLLQAYQERAEGTKTLIFNAGINTSRKVYELFKRAKYPVKHIDSTYGSQERRETLEWFHTTEDAILTSVGILTTGFDEPTVQTILLNRATKSLTLYHQMIGRGSRVVRDKKKDFQIIDLGNNALRLGLWEDFIDWQDVFRCPDRYLYLDFNENQEPEMEYVPTREVVEAFANMPEDAEFNVKDCYDDALAANQRPKVVIEASIDHHVRKIRLNCDDMMRGLELMKMLHPEIEHRIGQYRKCINGTENYASWMMEEYIRKLRQELRLSFD